jgi:hypothetical protein
VIWHIFKKDVRLLWHYALGVAVVQGLGTVVLYRIYNEAERSNYLQQLFGLVFGSALLGAALLVAAVVHLDAIPGVRQDWLVRPISRRDLLIAKLLFVILLVQGPTLVTSWAGAVAQGFGWGQSFGAALSHSLSLLVFLYLPMMGFASLTRNFAETAVGVVICAAGFAGLTQVASMITYSGENGHVNGTGPGWLLYVGYALIMFFAAAAILSVQYFRRQTLWARGLTIVAALLVLLTALAPWKPVFAIEQRLSPEPGAAANVRLEFQPGLGRHPRSGGGPPLDHRNDSRFEVVIPVGVSGLMPDSILAGDLVTASMTDPDGKRFDLGLAGRWQILNEGPSTTGKALFTPVYLKDELYAKLQNARVRLELDYSLTLLRLSKAHALPAIEDRETIPGVGRCETLMNPAGTAVQVKCLEAGLKVAPTCMTYFLEHVPSGRRNPVVSRCWPSYMPFFAEVQPDAMMRFGAATLPFHDPSGLAVFPVDGPMLKESRVVMRIYQPLDHFVRHVVIPDVRLSDWLP